VIVNEDCTECVFGDRKAVSNHRVPPQVLIFVALLNVYWELAGNAVILYEKEIRRRQAAAAASRASSSSGSGEQTSWSQGVFNSLNRSIEVLVEDSPRSNFGLTTYIGSNTHTSVSISKGCRIRVKGGGSYSACLGEEIIIP